MKLAQIVSSNTCIAKQYALKIHFQVNLLLVSVIGLQNTTYMKYIKYSLTSDKYSVEPHFTAALSLLQYIWLCYIILDRCAPGSSGWFNADCRLQVLNKFQIYFRAGFSLDCSFLHNFFSPPTCNTIMHSY